jgi:2-hydroxy-6-oxonona-2,4-dienedioate hydrolase
VDAVVPTTMIHGRDDRVVNFEHGLRLATTIDSARLVMLNRCGHWVQIERAEEFKFNGLLKHFVQERA